MSFFIKNQHHNDGEKNEQLLLIVGIETKSVHQKHKNNTQVWWFSINLNLTYVTITEYVGIVFMCTRKPSYRKRANNCMLCDVRNVDYINIHYISDVLPVYKEYHGLY